MPTKKSSVTVPVASQNKHKSKGKQHPVHAESLDNLADDFDAGPAYPTGQQVAKWFRKEATRIRSILR